MNNVSVTEDDEITVAVNDYLNPFSPQDGVCLLYTSSNKWVCPGFAGTHHSKNGDL